MQITDVKELMMLKNIISPKSSATTTETIPGWEKFSKDVEILSVQYRNVISIKESSMNKEFTILEGVSTIGKVNLTIEEAGMVLTGVKSFKVGYKASASKDANGANYINLVILDNIQSQPQPTAKPEEPAKVTNGK